MARVNRRDDSPMSCLRLILGDQLDPLHPWFGTVAPDVLYVLMEVRQETDYVLHHAQKVLAIFAAMRRFAEHLRASGHRVAYLAIDDPDNRQSLPANLDRLIDSQRIGLFEYQLPDEWRLDQQLKEYAERLTIPTGSVDSAHFLTARHEAAEFFGARKRWRMEDFYREMRRRHCVLLEHDGSPWGGRWNFDAENRKPWRGQPPEPPDLRPMHDQRELWARIQAAGVQSFGDPAAGSLRWPLDRAEALDQLDAFLVHALAYFGDFQDASSGRAPRLFHSLLSFALNTKMLSPREVIERVEATARAGSVSLASAEGFIRQILGWREYVRGVYWARMPGYAESNFFAHVRPLPHWFWTGHTRMACLRDAISQSLQNAHAHHIQRLMLIGNFALLAGLAPQAVHRWYLGIYIDAFEWVELPNTLGMSQFADGGLLASKPYVSAAAYLHRMGDHCPRCHYRRDAAVGERACPFNALYWDFLDRNRERLASNPRLAMPYRQLARMPEAQRHARAQRSAQLLADLDAL